MTADDNDVVLRLDHTSALPDLDRGYQYGLTHGYANGYDAGHLAGFRAGLEHAARIIEGDWAAMREHITALASGEPYAALAERRGQHQRAEAQRLILAERGIT